MRQTACIKMRRIEKYGKFWKSEELKDHIRKMRRDNVYANVNAVKMQQKFLIT